MNARPRVLRVVTLRGSRGRYGGPADTAHAQANLLASSGFQTTLLYGVVAGEEPEDAELSTVRHVSHAVRVARGRFGFVRAMSARLALAILREVRAADVAYVSFAREAIPVFTSIVALACRRPLVVQPHGMLTSGSSRLHRIIDLFTRPIVRRATTIVALTSVEESDLRAWGGSSMPRIACIGNPLVVDVPADTPPNQDWDCLFLGRIHERKRPWVFLDAAAHSQRCGRSYRYALVGPLQVDEEVFEQKVRDLDNTVWTGPVSASSVATTLLRTKVFALPSKDEPWGNVLLLALALGLPCIVTKSAALSKDIASARAGIVVDDGDPIALADALDRLLSDRKLYMESRENALALFNEKFSTARVRAALNQAVTDVLFA